MWRWRTTRLSIGLVSFLVIGCLQRQSVATKICREHCSSRQTEAERSHKTDESYCVTTSALQTAPKTYTQLCYTPVESAVNSQNVKPFFQKHLNKTGVLLCTGPTLNEYVHQVFDENHQRVVTVGVNGIIFSDTVQTHGLDYLFIQDTGRKSQARSENAFYKKVDAYTSFRSRAQTFYGLFRTNHIGPTDEERRTANALYYEAEYPACPQLIPLVKDVGRYTFGGSCSVAMAALQFILYSGVSEVKLVGCDVTSSYSWEESVAPAYNEQLLEMWRIVPEFVAHHYPDVRIEVVRPVGLKDIDFNKKVL